MSVATSTALIIGGGLAAAGGVAGAAIGSSASKSAAQTQAAAENQALDFQKQQFSTTQANQQPFVQAGQGSIQKIIESINNGTFGPGSIPQFQLPTLEQAQKTPGYQFAQQQGEQGITRGAAAAGGAFTGGTLKQLSEFNSGLATTTYQQQVQNALSSYQALLSGQQQEYNQLANVASLGENAAANVGNAGVATGAQVGQTLGNLGTAQASGIVGSANAINGGIGSISNIAQLYGLINSQGLAGTGTGGGGGALPVSIPGSTANGNLYNSTVGLPAGVTGTGG